MRKQDVSERFWSKVDVQGPDDCWEWQAHRDRKGYGKFQMSNSRPAHRVAWELANGAIQNDLFVCHRCDNPSCCNPAHLFLGTNDDNLKDAVRKGRTSRGVNRPNSKLTPEIVIEARRRYQAGEFSNNLATEFGVDEHTMYSAIIGKKSWQWIDGKCPLRGHKGKANGRCKLSPEQVRDIRRESAAGIKHESLAEKYAVSDSTISSIVSGHNWAWLE